MNKPEQLFCMLDASYQMDFDQSPIHVGRLQSADMHTIYQAIIDIALRLQLPLANLTLYMVLDYAAANPQLYQSMALYDEFSFRAMIADLELTIFDRIQKGTTILQGKKILHTAPHHDDILLGYYPYAQQQLATNRNFVLYVTNGSNGVSDHFMQTFIEQILQQDQYFFEQIFTFFYGDYLEMFATAFRVRDEYAMQQARYKIFCSIVIEVFDIVHYSQLIMYLMMLQRLSVQEHGEDGNQDFIAKYEYVKGRIRQSESDCKWYVMQGHAQSVHHGQAHFYHDPSEKAYQIDVARCVEYMHAIEPDIITIALDPCGVGPATHFTTLKVLTHALQQYQKHAKKSFEIVGYRNVWSSFSIMQADMIVPVTRDAMQNMQDIFTFCFATQQQPTFPSPLYDGNFAQIAQQLQEHQLQDLHMLLGSKKTPITSQEMIGAIYLNLLFIEDLIAFIG